MSETYARGDRVVLEFCTDPDTLLKPGDEGSVRHVDDLGTVHIRWDSGSTLGLSPELGDLFHKVEAVADIPALTTTEA